MPTNLSELCSPENIRAWLRSIPNNRRCKECGRKVRFIVTDGTCRCLRCCFEEVFIEEPVIVEAKDG
jgi:hypothetical protein